MVKMSSTPQTGILIAGPGGQRLNNLQANLPVLTQDQHDLLNKAKKYALEQSLKFILAKPVATAKAQPQPQSITQQPPQQQQKPTQRHQALVLMCRVYVGSISFEMREDTIKAAFAPYGAVKSVSMTWDPVTLKHKGFAFVEYELPEAAQLALDHMNAIPLAGRQIKVGRPSNMPQAAPIIEQIQEECKERNRIYIANVHSDFSESDLANLFEPLGKVLSCKLALPVEPDNTHHRGYGFIEFDTEAALVEALSMDKFDLAGQTLHVCRATTPSENVSIYGTLTSERVITDEEYNSSNQLEAHDDDSQTHLERTSREQERTEIMSSSKQTASSNNSNSQPLSTFQVDVNDDGRAHNVLVFRNMIMPDEELDDDLWKDIYNECVRYGQVKQLVIKKQQITPPADGPESKDEVKVFIKYKNDDECQKAQEAINGRFFGGRKISVEYYSDQDQVGVQIPQEAAPALNGSHEPGQISSIEKVFSVVFQ